MQGVNGLTTRDVKLIMDGGYNTVESVAYTFVFLHFTAFVARTIALTGLQTTEVA